MGCGNTSQCTARLGVPEGFLGTEKPSLVVVAPLASVMLTDPDFAPLGTTAVIVSLPTTFQFLSTSTPPIFTPVVPPKLLPLIVRVAPTAAGLGLIESILAAGAVPVTLSDRPLSEGWLAQSPR